MRENEVAATCEKAGRYDEVVYCSVCEKELSRELIAVNALGHDFGEWKETKAPTCTEAGEETRTCSRCSKTETRVVAAAGHKPGTAVREKEVAAACEKAGSYDEVVYCSVCKAELSRKSVTVKALGHDFGKWTETKAPTCTKAGEEARTCSRCGKKETRAVNALGHSLKKTEAAAASCEKAGNSAFWTCGRCGRYYADAEGKKEIAKDSWVIPALGHDYQEVKGSAKEPSCTEAGKAADQKCSRCGKVVTGKEIPALGHDLKNHAAVAASCEAAGNSEYWSCERCGKYFGDKAGMTEIVKDSWVIPAAGHTEEKDPAVAATCTEAGLTEGSHCSVCGKVLVEQEEVKALGHDFGAYGLTRAAKPKRSGLLTSACSRCDASKELVIAPVVAKAVSHSGDKAKISWKSVKGAKRYKVYFGTCGRKDTVTVSTTKLSHVQTGLEKGVFYRFQVKAQRKVNGKWKTISTGYTGHFVAGDLDTKKKVTNVKSITVAKSSVKIKVGRSTVVKPKATPVKSGKKMPGLNHTPEFRYLSDNSDIAVVNKNGKITGKKAGVCRIYVVAVNGVYKAVKVTVK